ncbi:hypothetical protein ACFE04_019567 [Oxalis oulophora]
MLRSPGIEIRYLTSYSPTIEFYLLKLVNIQPLELNNDSQTLQKRRSTRHKSMLLLSELTGTALFGILDLSIGELPTSESSRPSLIGASPSFKASFHPSSVALISAFHPQERIRSSSRSTYRNPSYRKKIFVNFEAGPNLEIQHWAYMLVGVCDSRYWLGLPKLGLCGNRRRGGIQLESCMSPPWVESKIGNGNRVRLDLCHDMRQCPPFGISLIIPVFRCLPFSFKNKDLHRSELRLPLLQDRETLITYYENVVEGSAASGGGGEQEGLSLAADIPPFFRKDGFGLKPTRSRTFHFNGILVSRAFPPCFSPEQPSKEIRGESRLKGENFKGSSTRTTHEDPKPQYVDNSSNPGRKEGWCLSSWV